MSRTFRREEKEFVSRRNKELRIEREFNSRIAMVAFQANQKAEQALSELNEKFAKIKNFS